MTETQAALRFNLEICAHVRKYSMIKFSMYHIFKEVLISEKHCYFTIYAYFIFTKEEKKTGQ